MPSKLPVIAVRVTKTELRKAKAAAKKDGRPTSAWVLQLIRQELRKQDGK